jgi:hypothetical protein
MTNPSERTKIQTNEIAVVVLKALTSFSLGEGATVELTDAGRVNLAVAAFTMAFLLAKRRPELCDACGRYWSLSHNKDAEVMLDLWQGGFATAEIIDVLKGLISLSFEEGADVPKREVGWTVKLTNERRRNSAETALTMAFLLAKRRPELCDACGRYWSLSHDKDAEVMLDEWLGAYAREKLDKNKDERKVNTPESIAHEVKTAFGPGLAGIQVQGAGVWVREDGAVCFGGGENFVIKAADDGVLDVKIGLFSCPSWVQAVILERLKEIAGKGVRITYYMPNGERVKE